MVESASIVETVAAMAAGDGNTEVGIAAAIEIGVASEASEDSYEPCALPDHIRKMSWAYDMACRGGS